MIDCMLWVGGLHPDVTAKELVETFKNSSFAELCKLPDSEKPLGCAYVELHIKEDGKILSVLS